MDHIFQHHFVVKNLNITLIATMCMHPNTSLTFMNKEIRLQLEPSGNKYIIEKKNP